MVGDLVLTGFTGLLSMELVGYCEDVGVGEPNGLGDVLLDRGSGVENKLNPAGHILCSDVVLERSADLTLSAEGAVHKFVYECFFKAYHVLTSKLL